MKLRPMGNWVRIKRAERVKQIGSVIIPEKTNDQVYTEMRGTVVSVGPGKYLPSGVLQPTEVKKGDFVLFNGRSWYERPNNIGDDELMIPEDEIFGVITG